MNIITADFNWISLLIVIVATIIGMTKSNNKKQPHKPVFQEPDFNVEEDEEIEEVYTAPAYQEDSTSWKQNYREPSQQEASLPGDFYRTTEQKEEGPIYNTSEEEEKEEQMQFDIRQAIISSEILRRPQF